MDLAGGFRELEDEAEFVWAFEANKARLQPAVYLAAKASCGICQSCAQHNKRDRPHEVSASGLPTTAHSAMAG